MRTEIRGEVLTVVLDAPHRCLSSAVLGGGLGEVRSWVNAQVPADYARLDPEAHLAGISDDLGCPKPVVGMMTAALVEDHAVASRGAARVVATVGVRDPLAAASTRPTDDARIGTINVLAIVDAPLTDAGLVGAVATATEAKVQALATAGVGAADGSGMATGTATDSVCVACPPGSRERFAGPATPVGADLAGAVHEAVVVGAERYAAWRRENDPR